MTHSTLLSVECVDTIKPSISVLDFRTETLYFFRFVKEQYSLLVKKPELNVLRLTLHSQHGNVRMRILYRNKLVEVNGIEPMTSCLQSMRSPN